MLDAGYVGEVRREAAGSQRPCAAEERARHAASLSWDLRRELVERLARLGSNRNAPGPDQAGTERPAPGRKAA